MKKIKKKINKKTRYKKPIKKFCTISLLIILSIAISIIAISYKKEPQVDINKKQKETSKQIITNILTYQTEETITKEFLNWLNNNYGMNILKEINKSLKEGTYERNLWHSLTKNSLKVLLDKYNQNYENATNVTEKSAQTNTTILNFIGDVSLADNWYIMKEYDKRNKKVLGILDENIINIFKQDDITIANNEFTISDRGAKLPNKYYTFRGSPNRLSVYEEMSVDLVTLANNHIYDYGELAFKDSLEALKQYNTPYVGAGNNIEE